MDMKSIFTNLIQIGIVVKDMDQAVARLTALGIGPFQPKIIPPEAKETLYGKPFTGQAIIKAAMTGNVELELIQPTGGESPHMDFLNTIGEGFQHVAYAVEDVQEAVDLLTKQGVRVSLRAKMPGGGGVAYVDLGAANILVELVQRKPAP